jgi:NhaP-type Na+/H+ or K+/H+ antiporter
MPGMSNLIALALVGTAYAALSFGQALRNDRRENKWEWWAAVVLLMLVMALCWLPP